MVNEQLFLYLLHFDPKHWSSPLGWPNPASKYRGDHRRAVYQGGVAYHLRDPRRSHLGQWAAIYQERFEFTLKALFNLKVNAANTRLSRLHQETSRSTPAIHRRFTVLTDKNIIGETAVSNIPVLPEYVYDPNGWMKKCPLNHLTDTVYASIGSTVVPNGQDGTKPREPFRILPTLSTRPGTPGKGFIVRRRCFMSLRNG